MKKKITGKTYGWMSPTTICNYPHEHGDDQLHQKANGEFILVTWCDADRKLRPLTHREALLWCIKTQMPECFRGYLLESI